MRDVIAAVDRWRAGGESVALATVVSTWGSAPRRPGAKLALTAAGAIEGSVSGGCVEAAVVEEGHGVLATGTPRLVRYGVSDDDAWGVGLACGGTVEIWIEPLDPAAFQAIRDALRERRTVGIVTTIEGEGCGRRAIVDADGRVLGDLDETGRAAAHAALRDERSATWGEPGRRGFVDVVARPPRLAVVGAVHIAQSLIKLADTIGFETVVVDPRERFADTERFAPGTQIIRQWPDAGLLELGLDAQTAVAVLTHDPKLDDPALRVALASDAFYVGALGSRRTHARRRVRLREAGLSGEQIDRLRAPIGLHLGGRSPESIALSIAAEIVAVRHGGDAIRSDDSRTAR